jgi:RHS repeat-associated protein
LGTRRVNTDYAGVIDQTCSTLPFGEAIACTTSSPTEHLFTAKERDTESGNDYFGARYYSSAMGRFMSPDWAPRPWAVPYADFTDPQTLNLYSYVRNNPLNRSDSDGHCGDLCNWAISKVSTYLATHPDVGKAAGAAVDKAMNSLGIKVFAGAGFKSELGPVKLNANITVNASTSVDGKKDGAGLQATVGARAGDVGVQALNVSAPIANSDGLVNPLSNVNASGPALATSSSLTPSADGMDIAAKQTSSISADSASVGGTVNGGIALVGAQVTADISGWKDVAAAVVQGAVQDAKQFVTDLKTSVTCTATSGCAH